MVCMALVPVGYFGWKGIISSTCLACAGLLLLGGRRTLAAALILLLLAGQIFYIEADGARGSLLRGECESNLELLTRAILQYETMHGHLPPAYTTDTNGKALHSWRVLILPFLGETELYKKIDLEKPWDHPVNVPLHDQMPDVFCCAAFRYHSRWWSKGNTTASVVVVDETTAWRIDSPPSLNEITDGLVFTLAVVESERDRVLWMSPATPTLESFLSDSDFRNLHGNGYLVASSFNGLSVLIPTDKSDQQLRAMFTINKRDGYEK